MSICREGSSASVFSSRSCNPPCILFTRGVGHSCEERCTYMLRVTRAPHFVSRAEYRLQSDALMSNRLELEQLPHLSVTRRTIVRMQSLTVQGPNAPPDRCLQFDVHSAVQRAKSKSDSVKLFRAMLCCLLLGHRSTLTLSNLPFPF